MLQSCYDCVRKHLATAHACFQKTISGDGSYNFWCGIGQLMLAEEESRREMINISHKILAERILLLERFEQYPDEIIDICSQLGAAYGLLSESNSGRYPTHFWYAIGKMHYCEFYNYEPYIEIAKSIEDERLKMLENEGYNADFFSLIENIWFLMDEYDFTTDEKYWTDFDEIIKEVTELVKKGKSKKENKHG